MTPFINYFQTLSPALQKMASLYAYLGHNVSEDDKMQLSVHGVCMLGELPLMTSTLIKDEIVVYEAATHFAPEQQHVKPNLYAELLVYTLDNHPEWLDEFDKWPLTRHRHFDELQRAIRRCYTGKMPEPMVLDSHLPPYIISLANDRRYEPLLTMIRDIDFPAFMTAVLRKWMRNDILDEDEIMRRQMQMRKLDDADPEIRELKALHNYYRYICMGQYTPPVGIRLTYSDYLTKGVHAMSQGKGELALKVFGEALNAVNRNGGSGKGDQHYIMDGIGAFFWVMATWTSRRSDCRQRLQGFIVYAKETGMHRVGAAVLLADTLISKHQSIDVELLKNILRPSTPSLRGFVMQRHLAMLLQAQFTGQEPDAELQQAKSAFVRHEAQSYISINKFERKLLATAFGPKPVGAFVKTKEPWEQMVDRLIANESNKSENTEETERHRVMYIIMSDGESIELREQNLLKDGRWGQGKQLPWNRFISGTETFMDRTDQAIVADVRFMQTDRLTVGLILPHLVGSDRVYTGEYTPFRRVTIDSQKPYVLLQRTDSGFEQQSNVLFQDLLSQTCVYHRHNALHYTVFPMGEHERAVLQELLSVQKFPATAEDKLRQLLPLISTTTEVHSDLLTEEQAMTTAEPQSAIVVRLTPDPTAQTLFDTFLLVRPLEGGLVTVQPGKGDTVVLDSNESTQGRVRIERNIEAEKANLAELLEYSMNHDISFTEGLNGHLTTPQVLDILAYASTHTDICVIEWPEGERLRMRSAQKNDWNLQLTQKGRWFEIEGDVHLDDNSVLSAMQLLNAIGNSHGGYVQLNNGDYLWLSERLRKQLDTIESLTTDMGGHATISTLQTSTLAAIVNGEIDIRHDADFMDYKRRIEQAESRQFETPATLQATLRPYQQVGYQWMMRLAEWGAGACLADDMGLGKTVQTIAFLLARGEEGASFVVAPASVVGNWRNELNRFAPSLTVFNLNEENDRAAVLQHLQPNTVVLSTYGLLVSLQEQLTAVEWNTICLDEAHHIKNRGTKTSAVCMELKAHHRIILTGTPVQNHLGELWNLFQFINPGLLGNYEMFNQKFIIPIENLQDTERQQQLQALAAPFMLRRTKDTVVKELPAKTEININVELTQQEMAFYEVIRREAEQKVLEAGGQMSINALAELTRLRRAACALELIDPQWAEGSSKIDAFMELAQDIVEGGHSVLVFSQFTSFLTIIAQALKTAGIGYLYLDGSIPLKQREQLVNDFQKGKQPIFLISLKAGGVGLNLTTANYVIHLDPWWNPAIEQQATDRAYRIGQTQAVTVYHLVSHHTIEEKILRLHESKRALSDSILQGADQNFKLTAEDMMQMLSNQW
ncbi:MAG: DEAD/DEAH box helicase [Bacteroidaceae bacterium]|nr:DEAD/DEAH box helicase [Bacteroidaceae bacterium]